MDDSTKAEFGNAKPFQLGAEACALIAHFKDTKPGYSLSQKEWRAVLGFAFKGNTSYGHIRSAQRALKNPPYNVFVLNRDAALHTVSSNEWVEYHDKGLASAGRKARRSTNALIATPQDDLTETAKTTRSVAILRGQAMVIIASKKAAEVVKVMGNEAIPGPERLLESLAK